MICNHFKIVFFLVFNLIGGLCPAQYLLSDVIGSFKSVNNNSHTLHLKKNHIKIPSGGHLQGIQALSDSEFILTGSSTSYCYYLTANQSGLTAIYKIRDAPYRHAGGCQISGTEFAVGIEDNKAKDKSEVVTVSLVDSVSRRQINPIIRRAGTYKRSTAGAVGVAKTDSTIIIAVGAWDSRDIDFYSSRLDYPKFDSMISFHAPANKKWCSYQSINLLSDAAGKIYLIGLGLEGSTNRVDLFEVIFQNNKADLRLLATRNFKCKGKAGFRYGSGIYIDKENKLSIYTCARNASAKIAVNVFNTNNSSEIP